jgi:conjugal transfer pilus assembly protein TraV
MLSAGCASTLNPFDSGFKCSATSTGECIPLNEAYDRSLEDEVESDNTDVKAALVVSNGISGKDRYKELVYKKVIDLLEEPKTPIVVPPKVVRVLVLPYRNSENTLYMQRYLYFFASEPAWIFDVENHEDEK